MDGIQTAEVGKVWETKAEIKVILQPMHVADLNPASGKESSI